MAVGRNVSFAWAWQSAWAAAAASGDPAWTFNAEAGQLGPVATEPREVVPLMGAKGDQVDPIAGPHDVSGAWSLPLCARQAGLWFQSLIGPTSAAGAAGSRGGFLFKRQPVAADTITVGATTFTFVAGAPSAGEIQIGASVLATVANAAAEVDGEAGISAEARGQLLWITHDTADDTGDTVVTAASAPGRTQPIAATLKGGGDYRHLWESEANAARPWASVEVAHSDAAGAYAYRLTDSMMVRSIALAKGRAGAAMMTADVLARSRRPSSSRTLAAAPTALTPLRFSQAAGSILLDGQCIGAIQDAGVTLGVELTAGTMAACGVDDIGAIGEPAVGDTSASMTLTARFPTSVLYDAAFGGAPVAVDLQFVNPATGAALFVTLPRVWLDKPGESAEGRGQLLASFSGNATVDPTTGDRYSVELFSPVAGWPAA